MVEASDTGQLPLIDRVGQKLQSARLAANLDLTDISERTRIPMRHLDAIERSDFGALPSFTYAAGFVRAYARTVGLDEVSLARDLRLELGRETEAMAGGMADEIADPARIPPRWLALAALLILILCAGGYALWRSALLRPEAPLTEQSSKPARPAARKAPAPVAPAVILTAKADVRLRVFDQGGAVLFDGVKKAGESFQLPASAQQPMLQTDRLDQISISLGGVPITLDSDAPQKVTDFSLSAAALKPRITAPQPPQASEPTNTATTRQP